MIKTIIFDFGGVVGSDANDWETNFSQVQEITGLSSQELNEIFDEHWSSLKIGKGNVGNFWQNVVGKSKKKIEPEELATIYNSKISINTRVLELVKVLKKRGFILIILSNESKEWMDIKIEKFKLDKFFDKIYCSAYLGISKPSIEIFNYVLRDLRIKASKIIFIDNQINNINIAEKLGIKTILYKNVQQLNEQLKIDLD